MVNIVFQKIKFVKMASTSSGPEKEKPKVNQTKSRREIWLLGKPLHALPKNRLPTNGEIVRRYYYLIRKIVDKKISFEHRVGCKRQSGSQNLVCHGQSGACDLPDGTKGNCIVRDVVLLWNMAGFSTEFLKGERSIQEQIVNLIKKFHRLEYSKTRAD